MKREQLLWLLTASAGAAPLLEAGQGSVFDSPGLRFKDGTFKITIFEDLHTAEESWGTADGAANDPKTYAVMRSVLDQEGSTDLVVLNGDLLSGEAAVPNNYTRYIDRIVQPLIEHNIPWASTYGNHDRSPTCSPPALLQQEKIVGNNVQGKRLAWTDSMVQGDDYDVGTSNYYVPIYSSKGGGNPELAMVLWFFDSRDGKMSVPDGTGTRRVQDWVSEKVVNWYLLEQAAFKKQFNNQVVPSLAFVHIPIQATLGLQQQGIDSKTTPGINDEIIGHQGHGTCDADGNCAYDGRDSPFMKALVDTEGLMAVFSGHDHGIDWCMKWTNEHPLSGTDPPTGNGLNLCFGRHTGYGGYNRGWARGARQIVLHEDLLQNKELETWIRLEDGTISGHVTLNSTYGHDAYSTQSST